DGSHGDQHDLPPKPRVGFTGMVDPVGGTLHVGVHVEPLRDLQEESATLRRHGPKPLLIEDGSAKNTDRFIGRDRLGSIQPVATVLAQASLDPWSRVGTGSAEGNARESIDRVHGSALSKGHTDKML